MPSYENVGRNDPCPCGSGKKYKKCHMRQHQQKDETSQAEWNDISQGLTEKLLSYLNRPRFDEDYFTALELFFPDKAEQENPMLAQHEEIAFYDYLVTQHRLRSTGRNLMEHYLEEHETDLSSNERTLLRNRLASRYGLYEVQSVTPGEGMVLKDLFRNDEIEIHEESGSQQLHRWDVFGANLYKIGDQYQISGHIAFIPRDTADRIQGALLQEFRRYKEQGGELDLYGFLKDRAYLVDRWVREKGQAPPTIVNKDGDEMVWCIAHYRILDRDAVLNHFSEEPMFDGPYPEDAEEVVTWQLRDYVAEELGHTQAEIAEPFSIFGTLWLEESQLTLEVNSEFRLEVARDYLEDWLGDCLEFQEAITKDYDELIREQGIEDAPPPMDFADAETDEEVQALLDQYLEDYYYGEWVYEPIPALDGLTPIEAYTEAPDKLDELLKTLENRSARTDMDAYTPDTDDLRGFIASLATGEPYPETDEARRALNTDIERNLGKLALNWFEISREQRLSEPDELRQDDVILYATDAETRVGYVDAIREDEVTTGYLQAESDTVSKDDIIAILTPDQANQIERSFTDILDRTQLTIQFATEFDLAYDDPILKNYAALLMAVFDLEDAIFGHLKETMDLEVGFDISFQPKPTHYVVRTGVIVTSIPEVCAVLAGENTEHHHLLDDGGAEIETLADRLTYLCILYSAQVIYSIDQNRRLWDRENHRFRLILANQYTTYFAGIRDVLAPLLQSIEGMSEQELSELSKLLTGKI